MKEAAQSRGGFLPPTSARLCCSLPSQGLINCNYLSVTHRSACGWSEHICGEVVSAVPAPLAPLHLSPLAFEIVWKDPFCTSGTAVRLFPITRPELGSEQSRGLFCGSDALGSCRDNGAGSHLSAVSCRRRGQLGTAWGRAPFAQEMTKWAESSWFCSLGRGLRGPLSKISLGASRCM